MSRRTMIDELQAKGWAVVHHGWWYYIIAPGAKLVGGRSWATESEAWDCIIRAICAAPDLVAATEA